MAAPSRTLAAARLVALLVVPLVATLVIAETAFALLLASPGVLGHAPRGLLSHLRGYYLRHDRVLAQSLPECAMYDPGLFYTMRPGTCRFRNREFDTTLRINSKGVRDTEDALQAPEVVVLGDSFAMGWGVEQDEAFPQVLRRLSGRRVLNTGVPSYGTVREAHVLDRLDTSQLRFLVVEYSSNDAEENRLFEVRGNTLVIGRERLFGQDVQRGERRHRYHVGKITFDILHDILIPPHSDPPVPPPTIQARLFINALVHGTSRDLASVGILVLELDSYALGSSDFMAALQREAATPDQPPFIRRLRVADLSGRVLPEDYFVLDDHLRASGHAKVAGLLLEKLREMGL
jgi:lysophospholipase L1-like esterase